MLRSSGMNFIFEGVFCSFLTVLFDVSCKSTSELKGIRLNNLTETLRFQYHYF